MKYKMENIYKMSMIPYIYGWYFMRLVKMKWSTYSYLQKIIMQIDVYVLKYMMTC